MHRHSQRISVNRRDGHSEGKSAAIVQAIAGIRERRRHSNTGNNGHEASDKRKSISASPGRRARGTDYRSDRRCYQLTSTGSARRLYNVICLRSLSNSMYIVVIDERRTEVFFSRLRYRYVSRLFLTRSLTVGFADSTVTRSTLPLRST